MRASRRRSQNSSALAPRVKRPRSAKPSASSRASAISTWLAASARARRERGERHGPRNGEVAAHERRPPRPRRSDAGAAASAAGSATSGTNAAPGKSASTAGRDSVASQRRSPASFELHAGRASGGDERLEPRLPGGLGLHHHELEERVVQLLGVARLRARLLAHARDRLGVEPPELARVLGQPAAERHRARAALLERRVVEERVRPPVQDLVRERGRLARVAEVDAHARRSPSLRAGRRGPPRRRPRSGSRRASGARAGGRAARPDRCAFSWQAASAGNTAAIRSSASMRWIGGGTRLPPRWRSSTSERPAFQRQRTAQAGASRSACASVSRAFPGVRKPATASSGKLCCAPSESTTASSLAAAWSSKSKLRQKRLRSASPSARLMRPPNGACTTSCMPPDSSKKRSKTTSCWVGTTPSASAAGSEIAHDLLGAAGVEPGFLDRARRWRRPRRRRARRSRDLGAQRRHLGRELRRARGRLAQPERHRGRRAARVGHAHYARLDAPDAPRRAAEQEHVAGHALDGPVLVHRADEGVVGIEQHAVVGGVGDRAAGGERREARAAPAAQHRRSRGRGARARRGGRGRSATPSETSSSDGVEVLARELRVGRGAPREREERVLGPRLRRARRDELLRQDVERRARREHAVEARRTGARSAAAHSTSSSRVVG